MGILLVYFVVVHLTTAVTLISCSRTLKSEMRDCSCNEHKHDDGGGDELASSEEGRVQQSHQCECEELVKHQSGGKIERLFPDSSFDLGGIVNYLRCQNLTK